MPISMLEFFGLVLYNLMFVVVFAYFVLRLDSDPSTCLASTEDDHNFMFAVKNGFGIKESESAKYNDEMDNLPQGKVSEEQYVDIGQRFRLIFLLLFCGHLA